MEKIKLSENKLNNKQPSNLEAEQALLGSILVNNDIIDEIANIINPTSFYDPAHTKIYEVIETLNNKGGFIAAHWDGTNSTEEAIKKESIPYQRGGTYVVMEGPQFSTLAESNLYRSWKADVIGMTNMPEAKLAREAEIRYASVSMVTDFDCWHPDHENVDVQQVIKVLLGNAEKAKIMIKNLIDNFESYVDPNDPTNNCLDVAIITCLLYTSPSPRDVEESRMPSSA